MMSTVPRHGSMAGDYWIGAVVVGLRMLNSSCCFKICVGFLLPPHFLQQHTALGVYVAISARSAQFFSNVSVVLERLSILAERVIGARPILIELEQQTAFSSHRQRQLSQLRSDKCDCFLRLVKSSV